MHLGGEGHERPFGIETKKGKKSNVVRVEREGNSVGQQERSANFCGWKKKPGEVLHLQPNTKKRREKGVSAA